jgi:hypothetical protein
LPGATPWRAARFALYKKTMQRRFFGRHYAVAVTAIIFVALLAAAGLRSTPGVLMVPWEEAFGWSRQAISFAAAIGIFLFGLTGPFAAAAMQRFGHSRHGHHGLGDDEPVFRRQPVYD